MRSMNNWFKGPAWVLAGILAAETLVHETLPTHVEFEQKSGPPAKIQLAFATITATSNSVYTREGQVPQAFNSVIFHSIIR
jgi:hypothetical protein